MTSHDCGGRASELEGRLGHTFGRPELLERSLAHRSWCAEHPGTASNERLEFLGDSVLGLLVTQYIYDRYPNEPEGVLAKIRASVVSEPTLAKWAEDLDLGSSVRLGRGEHASGGATKPSILSDAMEAVLGAIWLDGGQESARELVGRGLAEAIDLAAASPGDQDHKTRLQEIVAQAGLGQPVYEVTDSGPDHDKWFRAAVDVGGAVIGRGEGRSKKLAEQAAASDAQQHRNNLSPIDAEGADPIPSGHEEIDA